MVQIQYKNIALANTGPLFKQNGIPHILRIYYIHFVLKFKRHLFYIKKKQFLSAERGTLFRTVLIYSIGVLANYQWVNWVFICTSKLCIILLCNLGSYWFEKKKPPTTSLCCCEHQSFFLETDVPVSYSSVSFFTIIINKIGSFIFSCSWNMTLMSSHRTQNGNIFETEINRRSIDKLDSWVRTIEYFDTIGAIYWWKLMFK